MQESTSASKIHYKPASIIAWIFVITILTYSVIQIYNTLYTLYSYQSLAESTESTRIGSGPSLSNKIKRVDDRQYLWARGPLDPTHERSQWFDLTGSPLPLENFQYGIGRDTIPSIDKPVYVDPDDPRLIDKWNRYTRGHIDQLKVIGVERNGIARAYPIALLNGHELVNDDFGGIPVTIGW